MQENRLNKEYYTVSKAKVRPDLCVTYDKVNYGMKKAYIGADVEVWSNITNTNIVYRGVIVKSYPRGFKDGMWICDEDTNPTSIRDYGKWTPGFFINWANKLSPVVAEVIYNVLESKEFPNRSFKSCIGILSYARKYGTPALIKCCSLAIEKNNYRYVFIKRAIAKYPRIDVQTN